jgi:hypothetical protein
MGPPANDNPTTQPARSFSAERYLTVKTLALATVPPGVVTFIVPVVAPFGTLVVMLVWVLLRTVAGVPLKLTCVVPRRYVPTIVTFLPTFAFIGLTFAIVGGGAVTLIN